MADFETSAELTLELDEQSLRSVKDDIEDGIGSVPVSVEGGRATTGGSAMMDGGTGAVESQLDTTNDLLDDILDEVENSGGGGGFLGLGGGGTGGGGGSLAGGAGAGAAGGLFARYFSKLGGSSGASAGGSVVFQSIIDQLTGRTPAFGTRKFDQDKEFNRENTGPIVTQVAEFLNLYDNQPSGQGGSGQESGQTDTVTTGSEKGGTDVGNNSGNDIDTGDVSEDEDVPDSTFDEGAGAGSGKEPLVPGTDIGRGGGSGSGQTTTSPASGYVPPAVEALIAGNKALDGRPAQKVNDFVNNLTGGDQQGTPDQVSVDVSVDNQRNQQQIVRDISREVEKSLGKEIGGAVSDFL